MTRTCEPYDPDLGCLAVRQHGNWYVVAPDGTVLAHVGSDEYEARTLAQYINLTHWEEWDDHYNVRRRAQVRGRGFRYPRRAKAGR